MYRGSVRRRAPRRAGTIVATARPGGDTPAARAPTALSAPVLVILAKVPVPGLAKTRLIPVLGPEGAARLAAAMAADVFATVAGSGLPWRVEIAGDPQHAWVSQLPGPWQPQAGGDLGDWLSQALAGGGIAIGTDAPLLDPALLHAAAAATDPVFLGSAEDGGYTLVRASAEAVRRGLFRDVAWSTAATLSSQVARAHALDLPVTVVPGGYDVDDGPSLTRLRADLARLPATVAPHTRTFLASL